MGFEIRPLPERPTGPRVQRAVVVLEPRPKLDDVEYLFDVARRLARQAGVDRAAHAGAAGAHAAATGTVDALLWVLGATDVPASRMLASPRLVEGGLRSDNLLAVELIALENRRAVLGAGGQDHYLRGAADAVCFALGWQAPFWWAPLPFPLRQSPLRDEIGRRVA